MIENDEFWKDPFHECAMIAFFQEAVAAEGIPDSEKVKQRAYELYERRKNG